MVALLKVMECERIMDEMMLFLVIGLYVVVAYLVYTKMKMRNVVLELEYRVEEMHKRIEEHEGIHADKAHGKSKEKRNG